MEVTMSRRLTSDMNGWSPGLKKRSVKRYERKKPKISLDLA